MQFLHGMYKYDRIVVMSCPPFNLFYSQINFDCARHLGVYFEIVEIYVLICQNDLQLYKPQIGFHLFQGHRP
jgi:hypothetical protein